VSKPLTEPRPIGPLVQWGIQWRDSEDRLVYGTVVYATDEETILRNFPELEELEVLGKFAGSLDT